MKVISPGKQIFNKIVSRVKDFAYDRFRGTTFIRTNDEKSTRRALTYDVVRPQIVSEENHIPSHINTPRYAFDDTDDIGLCVKPILKTKAEIEIMRSSCRLAKKMLNAAKKHIKVGMTTDELDKYIHELIIKNQAYPSPLRYQNFPKSICTSVNNIVCHGIPDNRSLMNGDIITVDVTVYYQGYHGDCAATFLVGEVDEEGQYLVHNTEDILMKAISACKPGERLSTIAKIISRLAESAELTVIPSVFGHGIGQDFHEMPSIEHSTPLEWVKIEDKLYRFPIETDVGDELMLPGMTFTIEPALGTGTQETELYEDGWTLATVDDSRTAQFEHTILITETGAEVLTK